MQGSKSVQKRKREEAEEVAATKVARQARKERRKRGHVRVPRKGRDAERDAREKDLARVATKCALGLPAAVIALWLQPRSRSSLHSNVRQSLHDWRWVFA